MMRGIQTALFASASSTRKYGDFIPFLWETTETDRNRYLRR